MTQSLTLGSRRLGDGEPCFVVAEISGNHGQDLDRCRAIVAAAHAAGADAIKLQAYTADTITLDHDGEDFRIPAGNSWADHGTLHRLYARACTPWEWFEPLFEQARELGMEAFCSVFDHSSVDWLERLDAPAYKIAAPEITDVPLLRRVAATGKPVILSSGLADREDLQLAVDTLRTAGCDDIVMLKCTSEYPAPIEQANLATMAAMRDGFDCLTGLSDHTLGTSVPVAAVALGATLIEKHLTLDEMATVDSFFSLRPDAFAEMVRAVRDAQAAVGRIDFARQGLESGTAKGRRSLYVCQPIAAGEPFSADNVRSVRPAGGLHPRHWDEVMDRVAATDLPFGHPLCRDDLAERADRVTVGDSPSDDREPTRTETRASEAEIALRSLLVEAGAVRAGDAGTDYRFIDDDSLDSFTRISLCLEIESAFGISLAPERLLDAHGGSVAGIAASIELQRAA